MASTSRHIAPSDAPDEVLLYDGDSDTSLESSHDGEEGSEVWESVGSDFSDDENVSDEGDAGNDSEGGDDGDGSENDEDGSDKSTDGTRQAKRPSRSQSPAPPKRKKQRTSRAPSGDRWTTDVLAATETRRVNILTENPWVKNRSHIFEIRSVKLILAPSKRRQVF